MPASLKRLFNVKLFLLGIILLLSTVLNFYQLDKNPPGLYIDEVAIGVNAYSILKTGRDEYGVKFPVYFKSYGDYKLPVYMYLTSASMFLFGKNEFAVRFPSAFLGTLSVIFLYLLVLEISRSKRFSLLFAFLLSVSPWFMQFVGPAFEVTAAFSFFYLACYLLLVSGRRKSIFLYAVSLLFFVIASYTYHSYKFFTPLIFLLIIIKLISDRKKTGKGSLPLFLAFVFLAPVLYAFFPAQANARFLQTSAFPANSANNIILFLRNYISYFSTDFLFNFGDGINRHQFLNFGVLSRWTLPFLAVGIYSFVKRKKTFFKYAAFVLLAVAPIPASLALPSPHSLRSLTIVVPYILLITFGIVVTLGKFKKYAGLFALGLTLAFVYEFSVYLHFGFFHYPKTALIDWGGNFKEVVEEAAVLHKKYPIIVVNQSMAASLEYFRFYNEDLKPLFIDFDWNKEKAVGDKPVLLITSDTSGGSPPSKKLIDTVYLPNINKNIFAQFWEI